MVGNLFKRGAMGGLALLSIEAVYALLKPTPVLESFDPSGSFGDPTFPLLRVFVLGDSSVIAPGVEGPEEIWVSLVCQRLAVEHHVVLESFAVGGSMAHNVIADQLPKALSGQPDLIFVSIGANDVIKGVPTGRFARNLDHLIGELSATGATVVQSGVGYMGTIPRLYPPLSNLMARRAERFDRVHWKVAETHGTWVVDQRSDDANLWHRDRSLWAADLFHVSAAGQARWADTAWRTVGPLMNGSGG
jgi:lysophospholipase L1-like esterase